MYKEHDLVMLLSNQKAFIYMNPSNKLGRYDGSEGLKNGGTNDPPWYNNQHLYVLSDDKPKEGDWGFDGIHIFKCLKPFIANETTSGKNIPCFYIEIDNISNSFHEISCIKKIIATTDSSLLDYAGDIDYYKQDIQLIPTSFIQYFVEQYNVGNIITKVNVEYKKIESNCNCYYTKFCKAPKHLENGEVCRDQEYSVLKINPDNTINFKSIKDSFDINDIYKALKDKSCLSDKKSMDEWIQRNL